MIRAYNRFSKSAKTDYYISKKHWNTDAKADSQDVVQHVKKSYYDYKNANNQIAIRISRAKAHINKVELEQNRSATMDEVIQVLEGGSTNDTLNNFPAWAVKQIEAEYGKGISSTEYSYLKSLRSFNRFLGSDNYTIFDITHDKVKGWQDYLLGKGYDPATINLYVRSLSRIVKWARLDDHVPYDLDPFKRIKNIDLTLQQAEAKQARKNKEEDIFLVEQLQLTNPKQILARDFFLCCFYLRGMRASDMLLLRISDVNLTTGRVKYYAKKTSKKKPIMFNVKIPPKAKAILDKYCPGKSLHNRVFPYLGPEELRANWQIDTRVKEINKQLAIIRDMLGLKRKLTTRSARYGIADAVNRKRGELDVKEFLGHSNVEISRSYFNQDQDRIDSIGDDIY